MYERMLINALYNLVDAYFVSGLGKSQMGAISVVFPLGQVVVGLGLMFGKFTCDYRFFFISIYDESLPRPMGKEKNRSWAG